MTNVQKFKIFKSFANASVMYANASAMYANAFIMYAIAMYRFLAQLPMKYISDAHVTM